MFDDFFTRALIAGIGVALIAGPLGCHVVWRRSAYFGDTMAHAALLGVALAFLLDVNVSIAVFTIAVLTAGCLALMQRQTLLPSDTLLGILAHSTLALGLVAIAGMPWLRIDLQAFLFGDILAVSHTDIAVIYIGGTLVLAALYSIWRPLLAGTVNDELAVAEGMAPERTRFIFTVLMAAMIAIALKIVGVLLITSLLIIPAATARRFARSPGQMALIAAGLGACAVIIGLYASLYADTPSGPSIVVGALVLFLLSLLPIGSTSWQQR
ncbi:MAG: metal ABC transporter permease [Hyphomicrobiales bacterium]